MSSSAAATGSHRAACVAHTTWEGLLEEEPFPHANHRVIDSQVSFLLDSLKQPQGRERLGNPVAVVRLPLQLDLEKHQLAVWVAGREGGGGKATTFFLWAANERVSQFLTGVQSHL